jgi:hypothetical protein
MINIDKHMDTASMFKAFFSEKRHYIDNDKGVMSVHILSYNKFSHFSL